MDNYPLHSVFTADDDEDDRLLLQYVFAQYSPERQRVFAGDGLDLLNALAPVSAVALTTSSEVADRMQVYAPGANECLTKPLSIGSLGQTACHLRKTWHLDECIEYFCRQTNDEQPIRFSILCPLFQ